MSLAGKVLAALLISAVLASALPFTEASVQVLPGGAPITFSLDDADITWQVDYEVQEIEVTGDVLKITEETGDVYTFTAAGSGAEISVLNWAPHAVRGKVLSFSLDSGSTLINITGLNSRTYDLFRNGRLFSELKVADNCGEINASGTGTLWDVVIKSSAPNNGGIIDSPGNTKVIGAGSNNMVLLIVFLLASVMFIAILIVSRRGRR